MVARQSSSVSFARLFLLSGLFLAVLTCGSSVLAQEGPSDLSSPDPEPGAVRVEPGASPTVAASSEVPPVADPEPETEIADVPPPPESPEPDAGSEGFSGQPSGQYPTTPGAPTQLTEGPQVSSRIATRIRVLDGTYTALSARSGSRILDGIVAISSGALSITLGIVFDENPSLSTYLYVFGGASIGQGLVTLILSPDASDAALQFAHLPMRTEAEVQERLRFGENELESLASRARLARILDASIRVGAGVAIVPLYLGPNDFEVDPFGVIVLIGAGVSVVTGLINMFSPSNIERRWSAYEDLRDRLDAPESSLELDVSGFATPDAGGFTLTGRF